MHYFAYGSNMSERRLTRRIPARRLGVARLSGHRLAFTKPSESDGSAKCDIRRSSDPDDFVLGVLYEIDSGHKSVLDSFEGQGYGYASETVTITFDGQRTEALTYRALNSDDSLRPYHWYKEHVVKGALENGLPESYVEAIRSIPSQADPDRERSAAELSIYI